MKEIEVKILEIDASQIRKQLSEAGANLHFSGELHALFYDFSDEKILGKGDVLRLRKEGDEVVLAYKKRISKEGTKVMEELETAISDFESTRQILKMLGLQVKGSNRKFREEYIFRNSKIVLDDYQDELAHIPIFIEIESPNEAELFEIANFLGFRPEDCKSWDTRDLAQHYAHLGK